MSLFNSKTNGKIAKIADRIARVEFALWEARSEASHGDRDTEVRLDHLEATVSDLIDQVDALAAYLSVEFETVPEHIHVVPGPDDFDDEEDEEVEQDELSE